MNKDFYIIEFFFVVKSVKKSIANTNLNRMMIVFNIRKGVRICNGKLNCPC